MSSNSTLQALHIASFRGNVGDNANHNGTRRKLEENTRFSFEYTEEEIRKYYQNYEKDDALSFDEAFVERANQHDVVFIGSGNFFELWIEQSSTGTTVDITPERIEEVEVPLVFYGLGCDPYKGTPGENLSKFQQFLDHTVSADHCFVSVRNDGSRSHVERLFGEDYARRLHKVPDGGFFTEVDDHYHPELREDDGTVAINVAKDMPELRFPEDRSSTHTYDSFIDEFASFVDRFLERNPGFDVVLMPHIYSDLDAISDLLDRLENLYRRGRVTTAPYLNGEGAERYIFDTYRKADLAMGLRFHTNVCSIGQNTPSIGLTSYPKVGDLYEAELDMPERVVDVKREGFSDALYDLTVDSLEQREKIKTNYRRVMEELDEEARELHRALDQFLVEQT